MFKDVNKTTTGLCVSPNKLQSAMRHVQRYRFHVTC